MENLPTFKNCPSPSGGKVMCLWQKHSWGQKERSSGTQRLPLRGRQRSGRRWKLQWRPLQGRTRYWSCLFVIKPLRHGFLWLSHHIHQSSCYNFQQALAQAILDGAGISLPGGIKGRLFGVFLRPFYQDEPFFHQDLWLNAMTSWAPATQSLSTVFLFPSTWLSKALGIGDCHGFVSPL